MKYIITEKQLHILREEDQVKSLEPFIIKFFKILNEEKKKHKTRSALLEVIKTIIPFLSISENQSLYLLELYMLNYRKDGNYGSITKENFVDPRDMKGKRVSNSISDRYTIAQLPFKGSHLEGFWSKTPNGDPYYVVKSYGWYPLYIFKNNIWYEVTENYSSATSKQMYKSNPVRWSDSLSEKVVLLTPPQMEMLQNDVSPENLKKEKITNLKNIESNLTSKIMSAANIYDPSDVSVKFKIKSVDIENDKAIVTIDIYDVLKKENGKITATPENYLNDELTGITKDKVEKSITNKLRRNLRDYIGTRYKHDTLLDDMDNVQFKFNHLKQNS